LKTHLIFGLIALATMTGCTRNNTAIRQPTDDELFLRAKAKYERSLGSDYVVVTSVFVCATLDNVDSTKCDAAGVNTKLHPDAVEQGPLGIAYYHVKWTDGRTGYVKASEFDASVTFAELVECKRHGNPRVGMSAKQVVGQT